MKFEKRLELKDENEQVEYIIGHNVEIKGYDEIIIEQGVFVSDDSIIETKYIGKNSRIGKNTIVKSISIGRYCSIGDNCSLGVGGICFNNLILQKGVEEPIVIGNGVYIGNNVTIYSGIKIANGAIILDNSTVYDDVKPYSIYGGNPAVFYRYRMTKENFDLIKNCEWWKYSYEIIKNLHCTGEIFEVLSTAQEEKEDSDYLKVDCTNMQLLKKEKDRQIICFESNPKMEIFAISKNGAIYDYITNELVISGYCGPSYSYDQIKIYLNNEYIGDAEKKVERLDVYNNYPEYNDKFWGFIFRKEVNIDINKSCYVQVKFVKKEKIIGIKESEVKYVAAAIKIDFRGNYQIDYEKIEIIKQKNNQSILSIIHQIKSFLNKKIMMVVANCQGENIRDILQSSESFSSQYAILRIPNVQYINQKIDDEYFLCCDLIIYQYIKVGSRINASFWTNNFVKHVSADCQLVCIPNAFYMGYFPQLLRHSNSKILEYVRRVDCNIEDMFYKEVPDNIIKEKLLDENYYSEEYILENHEKSILELKTREERCDVTISDFILEQFRNNRLFYAENHPSVIVTKEIVERVLRHLKMSVEDIDVSKIRPNNGQIIPIYPSVSKALKLNFVDEPQWINKIYSDKKVDFKGYIDAYIDLLRRT